MCVMKHFIFIILKTNVSLNGISVTHINFSGLDAIKSCVHQAARFWPRYIQDVRKWTVTTLIHLYLDLSEFIQRWEEDWRRHGKEDSLKTSISSNPHVFYINIFYFDLPALINQASKYNKNISPTLKSRI